MTTKTPALIPQAQELARKIAALPGVEAVVLAGSLTAGTQDAGSDIDLYAYAHTPPEAALRVALAAEVAESWEVNNQFWETEDLLVLKTGTKAEIIWRHPDFIRDQLERTLEKCEAWVGYTTCFWANILKSQVLEDHTGRISALMEGARRPYPDLLVKNIVAKNRPLLAASLSSYARQTAQAEARGDLVTVQHRTAAFLASWFDILFALNKIPHPGEKKMVRILREGGTVVPADWEADVEALTGPSSLRKASEVMAEMDRKLDRIIATD